MRAAGSGGTPLWVTPEEEGVRGEEEGVRGEDRVGTWGNGVSGVSSERRSRPLFTARAAPRLWDCIHCVRVKQRGAALSLPQNSLVFSGQLNAAACDLGGLCCRKASQTCFTLKHLAEDGVRMLQDGQLGCLVDPRP